MTPVAFSALYRDLNGWELCALLEFVWWFYVKDSICLHKTYATYKNSD